MQRTGLIPPVKATVLFDDTLAKAVSTLTSSGVNVTNNKVLVIGAITYTFKSTITVAVKAGGTLTSDTTNPAELDTVTIGDQVYTFMEALTAPGSSPRSQTPNEILIGANTDATLGNLKKAIDGTGTPGTEYSLGTVPHTTIDAGTVGSNALPVTAKVAGTAGNALVKLESSAHLDWDGTGGVMTGGVDTVANEIKIGASAAATLDNIKLAINAGAGAGTNYSLGTVAHPTVTATTNADTTQVIEALTGGVGGNAIATTTDETTLTWTSTVMASGGGTVGSSEFGSEGGFVNKLIFIVPQLTGTPTITPTIVDEDGNTIATIDTIAENATSIVDVNMSVKPTDKIVLTSSSTVEDNLAVVVEVR